MYANAGFPDYIAFRKNENNGAMNFNVVLIESKKNGYLDPEEKKKCNWLIKNKIVNAVFIAKKSKQGGIEYTKLKYEG